MSGGGRLAVDGGTPVRSQLLPYGRQTIDDADIAAVVETLRSDWLTTGPKVKAFESAITEATGAPHAVAISNGTAALHAAVFAAGVGPDDEVITTPMTFAASANCVRYQGGRVVFADIQSDTMNIDPARVRDAITPRTRAIIAVDFTGQPADLDELMTLAEQHRLTFIEDAAHAFGATYHGRGIGSIAHLTTFSFHPVKHVTTAEGGAITTTSDELAERLRLFRNHGISTDFRQRERTGSWAYEMIELGFNYRLTDLQSALGVTQIEKAPRWLIRRREIARRYTAAFSQLPQVQVPDVRDDREPAWHLYILRLNLERLTAGREQIFKALRAENIGVNVHYIPIHYHPYYARLGYTRGQWPISEATYERIISLPMWPGMTDGDVADVIAAVDKVVTAYSK